MRYIYSLAIDYSLKTTTVCWRLFNLHILYYYYEVKEHMWVPYFNPNKNCVCKILSHSKNICVKSNWLLFILSRWNSITIIVDQLIVDFFYCQIWSYSTRNVILSSYQLIFFGINKQEKRVVKSIYLIK